MTMKRRTLDIMFSVGGLGLAVLLLALGLVLGNRAAFASDYVRTQLSQQDIQFPTADKLQARETAFTQARTGCVLAYAGQQVTTGEQAECYANEYLGGHLTWLATKLGMPQVAYVDGMSYTKLGAEQTKLKGAIATAQANHDPGVPALQQRLADVTTVRTKMFEGTTLSNGLLTAYGFGSFGSTAATAATVSYIVAGILLVLSIAGFVHALRTPRSAAFALPDQSPGAPHTPGRMAPA
jgi:hypothetical protein